MNTDERQAPQADAWAKWHEQRVQNGISVEKVAALFELDADIVFNMVGFGALPVVASPDGKHFFFDRRDIVRFVDDARVVRRRPPGDRRDVGRATRRLAADAGGDANRALHGALGRPD